MLDVLKFMITADNRSQPAMAAVIGDLGKVRGALASFEERAKRAGRAMRNIGLGASAAITAPLTLLGNQAIELFDVQRRAEDSVRTVLASTDGVSGKSADELFRIASGLQAITTYGDEDILQNVTGPLLTFTKVSGPEFERAQAAVLDMATLLQMDLKSASLQVGKALNDPVKGVSALARAGVQFTEQQKDVIESLVATGDVAAAQGLILAELETQFGGQAAAAAAAPLGKMRQLQNAIGDVKEELGEQIVPFLVPLVANVQSAVDWFSQLDPEVKKNIVVFGGLAAAAGPVLSILGLATIGLSGLAGAFGTLGAVLMANPILAAIGLIAGGAYLIYQNWDGIVGWFSGLWGRVQNGMLDFVGWIAGKFGADQEAAKQAFLAVWNALPSSFNEIWTLIAVGASNGWENIRGLLSTYSATEMILSGWSYVTSWFSNLWTRVQNVFANAWSGIMAMTDGWVADFRQIGQDIMAGLSEGVQLGNPVAAIGSSIGRRLGAAARDALGIQSPSRVFHEIGSFVMEGLGLGIRDNSANPVGAVEEVAEKMRAAGVAGGEFGSMFTGALRSVLSGTQSVTGALDQMLQRLADAGDNKLFDQLASGLFGKGGMLSGVADWFNGFFFNANGNVFDGGAVVPFASGGIVSSPVAFPMMGGRTGVMGEAGPEAIMPLARGSDGRLGVTVNGGSGAGVIDVRVHTTVSVDGEGNLRAVSEASGAVAGAKYSPAAVADDIRSGRGPVTQALKAVGYRPSRQGAF